MCSTTEQDIWLSTGQVAQHLGVSLNHVRRLIELGKLQARDLRVGSRAYYQVSKKSLEQYIQDSRL